jgi:hypothetical protein
LTPAEWVRQTRAKQGLPPTVEDLTALSQLAAAVLEQDTDDDRKATA